MGFKYKDLLRRVTIFSLIVCLLFSSLITPHPVYGESSNDMQASMINFFRDSRTSLNIDTVTRDEVRIYGVFISNFFLPGKTTLKDLKEDGELANTISTRFFGSAEKEGDVGKLNQKLYDGITKGLSSADNEFTLRRSSTDSSPISGVDFLKLLATESENKVVYTLKGNIDGKIDFGEPVMHAALKVLYGYSPDLFLNKNIGLPSMAGLYIDGLGNIWGEPTNREGAGATIDDYVLIMPAALNPITFARGNKNLKLPVANAFVMGATPVVDNNMFRNANIFTPYYAIKEHLLTNESTGDRDRVNMLSIYGVISPLGRIGNSNSIKISKDDNFRKVEDFITNNEFSKSNMNIVVAVDPERYGDIQDAIHDLDIFQKTEREDRISALSSYLNTSLVLGMEDLSDEMYYFDFSLSGGKGAYRDSGMAWEDSDLGAIPMQNLFTFDNNGKVEVYTNSSVSSPFNSFYAQYKLESNKNYFIQNKYPLLANTAKSANSRTDVLRSFLDTGMFPNNYNVLDDILTIAQNVRNIDKKDSRAKSDKYDDLVYGLFQPAKASRVTVHERWFVLPNVYTVAAYGLTKNDSHFAIMSTTIKNKLGSSIVSSAGGGLLKGDNSGGTLSWGIQWDKPGAQQISNDYLRGLSNTLYNFLSYRVFSMNSSVASQLTGLNPNTKLESRGSSFEVKTFVANEVNNWPGIYWGYMRELLDLREENGQWSSSIYRNTTLPEMNINALSTKFDMNHALTQSGGLVDNENKSITEMTNDVLRKVYALLTDGANEYREKWMKSIQDGWILSTHRSITGSWVGNVLSVSSGTQNSYTPIVGYISTPGLAELPITSWVVDNYMYIYILLMLFIAIILVFMVVTNVRTIHDGVLIFFFMAFILILPQTLLNNTINLSNKVGDKIYSDRFDYWAISQHQQTIKNLSSALTSDNEMDYLIAHNFEQAKNVYSQDAGVRVKWMSPKKDDVFEKMFTNSGGDTNSLVTNLSIFKWLFSSFAFQEEYVYNDPFATYLYRPYNAIANEAKNAYSSLEQITVNVDNLANGIRASEDRMMGSEDYIFKLLDKRFDKVVFSDEQLSVIEEVTALGNNNRNYRYWALDDTSVTEAIFRDEYTKDVNAGLKLSSINSPQSKMFLLYTESPFYYFYNALKARYSGVDGRDFKHALLVPDYYKVINTDNPKVLNTTRDFLDMEGLFSVVIPYLYRGNAYVYNWTSLYGKEVPNFDFNNDTGSYEGELLQQFNEERERKKALQQVWNLYSPWVDTLTNLDVYNKRVSIANKRVNVDNILFPGAYDEVGRPMIFSEADMYAKGYNVSDLTDVEMRIQRVLDATYKDMMYLVNYYDFDSEALLVASAMMATFNFNREFSDTNFIGESLTLYPQGFELKNFNYDAFMRLALMNATGEPLIGDSDMYARILAKTSIFTGLMLLGQDVMAIIVIPALKLIVLLLLLFLGLLVAVTCIISPPEQMVKMIAKTVLFPTFLFFVFNVVFAFVVSLFVGDGLSAYVGSKTPSVATNDPTITILLMLIVSIVYSIALFYLVRMLVPAIASHTMTAFYGTTGLTLGAFSRASNFLMRGVSGSGRLAGGIAGGIAGFASGRFWANRDANALAKKINEARGGELTQKGVSDVTSPAVGLNPDMAKQSGKVEVDRSSENVKAMIDSDFNRRNKDLIDDLNLKTNTLGTRGILNRGSSNKIKSTSGTLSDREMSLEVADSFKPVNVSPSHGMNSVKSNNLNNVFNSKELTDKSDDSGISPSKNNSTLGNYSKGWATKSTEMRIKETELDTLSRGNTPKQQMKRDILIGSEKSVGSKQISGLDKTKKSTSTDADNLIIESTIKSNPETKP